MTTLHREIETRLGVDDAFAFIADFSNAANWDPGVATSEAVNAGPAAMGSRYRLGVRLGSRVAPMEYTITAFEAPHRVVLSGAGSGISAVDEIRFVPAGAGTRIDYTADIRLGGVLRLAQPLLGGRFSKLADEAIEGMLRTLDARAAGVPA